MYGQDGEEMEEEEEEDQMFHIRRRGLRKVVKNEKDDWLVERQEHHDKKAIENRKQFEIAQKNRSQKRIGKSIEAVRFGDAISKSTEDTTFTIQWLHTPVATGIYDGIGFVPKNLLTLGPVAPPCIGHTGNSIGIYADGNIFHNGKSIKKVLQEKQTLLWNKDDALTVEIKSHGELTLAINNVVHPDFTITNVFELLKCSKVFPIICTSQLLDFSSFTTIDDQNVELDLANEKH